MHVGPAVRGDLADSPDPLIVADATGSGKTQMGAHLVRAVRDRMWSTGRARPRPGRRGLPAGRRADLAGRGDGLRRHHADRVARLAEPGERAWEAHRGGRRQPGLRPRGRTRRALRRRAPPSRLGAKIPSPSLSLARLRMPSPSPRWPTENPISRSHTRLDHGRPRGETSSASRMSVAQLSKALGVQPRCETSRW